MTEGADGLGLALSRRLRLARSSEERSGVGEAFGGGLADGELFGAGEDVVGGAAELGGGLAGSGDDGLDVAEGDVLLAAVERRASESGVRTEARIHATRISTSRATAAASAKGRRLTGKDRCAGTRRTPGRDCVGSRSAS